MPGHVRGLVLAGLLLAGLPAAHARQDSLGITGVHSASGLGHLEGRRFTFICPPMDEVTSVIWGTGTYADDSAICGSALHAGVLRRGQAGLVTIVAVGNVSSFEGTTQNGVTTQDYANGDLAFRFEKAAPAPVDWTTNALLIPDEYNQPVTVICPQTEAQPDAVVWGTDTYIASSSICLTAVHAGLITQDGGAVAVTRAEGVQQYIATERNGVTSKAWSSWSDAFTVAPGEAGAATAASGGRRVIRTAGYTGAGESAEVVSKTIRLAGYEGTGAATEARRLTIRTDGWAGSGPPPEE